MNWWPLAMRPSTHKSAHTRPQSEETFGARLARFRKERGFTQVELAAMVGMIQAVISDYERDKLRPYADVVARFAVALGLSSDELLGLKAPKRNGAAKNRRFLRRIQQIENLPKRDQEALLRTIDAFLTKASP